MDSENLSVEVSKETTNSVGSLIQHLHRRYVRFVVENAGQVSTTESSVRSLTYLLPGRFTHADAISETVYAGSSLLAMYHDSILSKVSASQRPEGVINNHAARFLRFMFAKDLSYKKISLILAVVRVLECSIEMLGHVVGGSKGQQRTVIAIETLKFICRLALFSKSNYRIVLTGNSNIPERDYDINDVQNFDWNHSKFIKNRELLTDGSSEDLKAIENKIFEDETKFIFDELNNTTWKGKRTGKEYLSIAVVAGKNNKSLSATQTTPDDALFGKTQIQNSGQERPDHSVQYLLSRALIEPSTVTALDLLPSLNSSPGRKLAELLYISRPLVYSLLLYKYGRTSWKPWIISLIVEVSSLSSIWDRTKPSTARKKAQDELLGSLRGIDDDIIDVIDNTETGSKGLQSTIYDYILKIGQVISLPNIVDNGILKLNKKNDRISSIPSNLSPFEWSEYKFRIKILLLYFLRSPFYESYTQIKLNGVIESGRKRILLSLFANILDDYRPLWENWYYYKNGY